MFTGASEFKFAYINMLQVCNSNYRCFTQDIAYFMCELYVQAVMYALNSGGNYQPAGPLHLAGGTSSWRTPLAKDIRRFDEFQASCTEAHSPPMLSCYCTCTYVRILPQCMLSSCRYKACSLKLFTVDGFLTAYDPSAAWDHEITNLVAIHFMTVPRAISDLKEMRY